MIDSIINEFRLVWRLMRDSRVPLWTKGIPVLAVLYIFSPIDLIPDVLLGLGQLDDLGVLLAGLRIFQSVVPDYIIREHRELLEEDVVEVHNYTVIDGDKDKRHS